MNKKGLKQQIPSILHNAALVKVLKIIFCVLGVFAILLLAHLCATNIKGFYLSSTVGIVFFAITPILVAILCRKQKGIRWHILICAIVVVLGSRSIFTDADNYISYDSNDYLASDSDFDLVAAKYLPSRERLANSSIIYFERQDYSEDRHQMYRITAKYDNVTFNVEHNKLQKLYDTNTENEFRPGENNFYLDGQFYICFVAYELSNDYGVAYHVCKESYTISYLFFRDDTNLPSMTAGDALSCGIFDEHRITCP